MLTPYTPRQQVLIVNNVLKACISIESLNKTGYNFLYQAQGFIAHYNLHGFRAHYGYYQRNGNNLRADILCNAGPNMWRNFRPGDVDYDYYKSKAEVYSMILNRLDPRPNGEWPDAELHKFRMLG